MTTSLVRPVVDTQVHGAPALPSNMVSTPGPRLPSFSLSLPQLITVFTMNCREHVSVLDRSVIDILKSTEFREHTLAIYNRLPLQQRTALTDTTKRILKHGLRELLATMIESFPWRIKDPFYRDPESCGTVLIVVKPACVTISAAGRRSRVLCLHGLASAGPIQCVCGMLVG